MKKMGPAAPAGVRIWDLPVRIFHWALVVLILFSWWSAENHMMERHRASGYTILGLLLFRLIWGFAGSETARFTHFARGPKAVWHYVCGLWARAPHAPAIGHNPLGGWSVLAMLVVLAAQVSLGLFAVDQDGLESGPLSQYISYDNARLAAELHEVVFNILVGLIVLHLAAILFHRLILGHNLIGPMIIGRGIAAENGAEPRLASLSRFAVAVLVSAAIAWFVAQGFRF